MAELFRSWVEIVSDGTSGGTHVYLAVSAGGKSEYRYEIPGVTTASWFCNPPGNAQLQLTIADASMRTRVAIDSQTSKMEELLTEIAASRLAHDGDDDSMTSMYPHAAHCATVISRRTVRCDCGGV